MITWNDENHEFYYYPYIYNEPDGEKYYTEYSTGTYSTGTYSTGTYSTPCKTALLFPLFFLKKRKFVYGKENYGNQIKTVKIWIELSKHGNDRTGTLGAMEKKNRGLESQERSFKSIDEK